MTDLVCHQPPNQGCEQPLVPYRGINLRVTVCQMRVNQTLAHQFDDDGFFFPVPTDCLKPALRMCYHRGDKKQGNDITAKKAGVVVMIYVDVNDPHAPGKLIPYLEFLIIADHKLDPPPVQE